jgi:hypothetical protein
MGKFMNSISKRLLLCAVAATFFLTSVQLSVAGQIYVADAGDTSESNLSLHDSSPAPANTLFSTAEAARSASEPSTQTPVTGDELTIGGRAARCRPLAVEWQNLASASSVEATPTITTADPTPLVDLTNRTPTLLLQQADVAGPTQRDALLVGKAKSTQSDRAAMLAIGLETLAL